jgi:hypothetical protein
MRRTSVVLAMATLLFHGLLRPDMVAGWSRRRVRTPRSASATRNGTPSLRAAPPVALTALLRVAGGHAEDMAFYLRTFFRLLSSWVRWPVLLLQGARELPQAPFAPDATRWALRRGIPPITTMLASR